MVRMLLLALAVMLSVLPAPADAQTPANCNANLFDQAIARDKIGARPGEIVNYTVAFVNRSVLPPPSTQIGCNVLNVTADFRCPGPTGAPNGTATNLVTDVDIPANDVVTQFGPFPCVMPDIDPGTAFAGVFGTGDLDDGGPSPFLINKTISVQVQSCLVKVDKQVSCDGGVTWVDPGLVFANEDGTHGCSAPDGTPIQVRYQAQNVGQTGLFACTLSDSNPAITPPGGTFNIPVGGSTAFLPGVGAACSTAFEAFEPNTGSVNCFCQESLNPNDKIAAFDVATVACQTLPELSLTKACVPGIGAGPDNITITASATSADLNFVNCTVTDAIALTSLTCPPIGPLTPVALQNSVFSLPAGTSQTATGSILLTANACNTASITCTIQGTALTRTATASAVCPGQGEGCLTRTPGFWGTHPDITRRFLPLDVCGVTLDNVTAGNGHSAIEAMCSVGKDSKTSGLGPQLVQLVRQCTAAKLNVAASTRGGGNCTGDIPSLALLLAGCCGENSVCTGDTVPGFEIDACIGQLDAFNNSIDTLDFGIFRHPGPADSSVCQDAKNNGVVVTPQ